MSDEEYEEVEVQVVPPEWAFSIWDIIGVMIYTVGLVLNAFANGAHAMAREFMAAANHSRTKRLVKAHQKTEERNRREIARHLEGSLYGTAEEK